MIKMNRVKNIAIIGLGQVGIYLYNELIIKKKEIEIKTGKQINVVAISAKNKNKKRRFKIDKKIFYTNPLKIFKENYDLLGNDYKDLNSIKLYSVRFAQASA